MPLISKPPISKRLFFALWPDAGAARQLHEIGRELQAICGGRLMSRETLHVTLAFLGQVPVERIPELEAIAEAVRAEVFDLHLDRLGYWSHNHILWAGCMAPSAALVALEEGLQMRLREAGFALEDRPFALHMTLLRKAQCESPVPLARVISWRADEMLLVESVPGGATRYVPISRWNLRLS
ncbi:MAG TPA: RNA 2',3'-cyclic phosphodiesterase [Rhodocyclaceae bacterium]|nr:RNA 2',3'-cyclic phosphodiesterase [Rhodocyclaceae bacterium]